MIVRRTLQSCPMSTRVQTKTSPSFEGPIATIPDVTASRISVSLEAQLAQRVRDIAAQQGLSVSAWIAEAVRQGVHDVALRTLTSAEAEQMRQAALSEFLDEVLAEKGWDREELIAEALEARAARRSA